MYPILCAAIFISLTAGGCRITSTPVPEVLSTSLSAISGPLRITWYLSPELSGADNLKASDNFLSGLVENSPELSVVVRSPKPGERQPDFLLPIPSSDEKGNMVFLWSSLVLDWRNHRIIIPDIWEPEWLALDLARALQDLKSGSPFSLGYLDGAADESSEGESLPLILLQGRWRLEEWHPDLANPDGFGVLMIRDGPGLDEITADLESILDNYVEGGGRVLVVGSSDSESSLISMWAMAREEGSSAEAGNGSVLFIENPEFLNAAAYEDGSRSFRDLDTALLLAAGRTDLISMMITDVGMLQHYSRKPAGSRLLKAASGPEKISFPDSEGIKKIAFFDYSHIDETSGGKNIPLELFSLEKNREKWFISSKDWRLPARSDRIESFLKRLEEGSDEVWMVSENSDTAGLPQDAPALPGIVFQSEKGRPFTLEPAGVRQAGGGVYFKFRDSIGLWPGITGSDISGDPRYWMERRLFPESSQVIRGELSSDKILYWRLHEEGGEWFLTRRNGKKETIDSGAASDYLGRLLRSESLTIAPVTDKEISALYLMIEDDSGRRQEYRLSDVGEGQVAASSPEGILHILDDTLIQFILTGPAGTAIEAETQ